MTDMRKYPPFPPHIAQAWHFLEQMLRGAQDPEFTADYFDRINKQALYIHKKAQKDPVIDAMLIAAIGAIEDKARILNAKHKKREIRNA